MAPQWNFLGKHFHFSMFENKMMPTKQYLKGDHPVDMELAPLGSHFGPTYFFSVRMQFRLQNDVLVV